MGSLFAKKKKKWVVTCQFEGGPAGASESGVQITVEGDTHEEAMQAGEVAAAKVGAAMAQAGVSGCRVVDCSRI